MNSDRYIGCRLTLQKTVLKIVRDDKSDRKFWFLD